MNAQVAFTAVALVLLLDAVRRFTATASITLLPILPTAAVVALALAPFLLHVPFVALASRARPTVALVVAAAAFAVSTRAAQLVPGPIAVIGLSGLAVLAGATLVALLYGSRADAAAPEREGSVVPEAFALALPIDLVRYAALGTADLKDLAGSAAALVSAVESVTFAALAALVLRHPREWAAPAPRVAAQLAAVPVLLAVGELAGRNAPQLAGQAGLALDRADGLAATATALVAIAAGLVAGSLVSGRASCWAGVAALLGGLLLAQARMPVVSLAGGGLLAAGLMICARSIARAPLRPARSALPIVAPLALGWVAFITIEATYYVLYTFTPVVWLAVGVLSALLLAARARLPRSSRELRAAGLAAVAVSVVLLLSAPTSAAAPPRETLRLMTYNIHFGFDATHRPALEEMALVIEREAPDVVVLQEAARGLALSAQHDSLGWLAQRLGMRYVYAPTIGDVFGNAVLTALPIEEVRRVSFARPGPLRHSPRGAMSVRIAGVVIVNTHLDEYVDAGHVREAQVRAVLDAWAVAGPIVVAGDLNARAESREIGLLREAGLRDLVEEGGGVGSTKDAERIDHIFGAGVRVTFAQVVDSAASDHRPVIVELRVR